MRSTAMLAVLLFRPRPVCEMHVDLQVGQFSSGFAQESERTGSACVRFPGVPGRHGPSAGAVEYCRVAGLGHASGPADVNTIVPVSHRGSLRPLAGEPISARNLGACNTGRCHPGRAACLRWRMGVSHSCRRVTRQWIRRFSVVAGHSLPVLLRPRLLFPLLRCVETGRGMGERPGRSVPRACRSGLLDTGGTRCCGRLLYSPGAFQSRHSRGPRSLVDGPGVSPCRPGA